MRVFKYFEDNRTPSVEIGAQSCQSTVLSARHLLECVSVLELRLVMQEVL